MVTAEKEKPEGKKFRKKRKGKKDLLPFRNEIACDEPKKKGIAMPRIENFLEKSRLSG